MTPRSLIVLRCKGIVATRINTGRKSDVDTTLLEANGWTFDDLQRKSEELLYSINRRDHEYCDPLGWQSCGEQYRFVRLHSRQTTNGVIVLSADAHRT
jgi:hypothetical protein